ncbi:hypothetical protein PR048_026473 [Dryococelus australis]|uniref:Uncharacterized protein n=1 Tax=Dryococelus australis TaxID=614101 RepID=A0ABQ9GLH5_9NEOP|nr:hypothetical protein PR048_026473 [Dryococelus australis]
MKDQSRWGPLRVEVFRHGSWVHHNKLANFEMFMARGTFLEGGQLGVAHLSRKSGPLELLVVRGKDPSLLSRAWLYPLGMKPIGVNSVGVRLQDKFLSVLVSK